MVPKPKPMAWQRYLLTWLCACVFLLSLEAKVSVYDGAQHGDATPTSSSKLWSNGAKLETKALAGFPVLWLAALCFAVFSVALKRPAWPRAAQTASLQPPALLFSLHRFLRPPPAFSR